MTAEQFKLTLENGETITCSRAGQGQRIGFIVGLGSFYFNGLSCLQNDYTFVAYDSVWKYGKSSSLEEKQNINEITKEDIKKYDHLVISALKKYFNVSSIDGFGFSAPGALLFEEALEHPEDYDRLIGTGIGLTELDPTFAKTNAIFYSHATMGRQQVFDEYQNKYKKFQSSIDGNTFSDPNTMTFFAVKPNSKSPLKPHKKFLAEAIAMAPKLLFKYSDTEISKKIIIEHWKHNPFREHVDKRMQEHFFINIYPQMNPLLTLLELAKTGKKILLIYGDTDFVTPLPTDIKQQLRQTQNIKLEIISDCSHIAYLESGEKYSEIITNFVMPQQKRVLSKL